MVGARILGASAQAALPVPIDLCCSQAPCSILTAGTCDQRLVRVRSHRAYRRASKMSLPAISHPESQVGPDTMAATFEIPLSWFRMRALSDLKTQQTVRRLSEGLGNALFSSRSALVTRPCPTKKREAVF